MMCLGTTYPVARIALLLSRILSGGRWLLGRTAPAPHEMRVNSTAKIPTASGHPSEREAVTNVRSRVHGSLG